MKYQGPLCVKIEEDTHTLEWLKSNGVEEDEILLLKGRAENFGNLQPLLLEISYVCKFSNAPTKTLNEKLKHVLNESAINKN